MPDESSSHVLLEPKEGKKPWKKKPAKQQITLSAASNIFQGKNQGKKIYSRFLKNMGLLLNHILLIDQYR